MIDKNKRFVFLISVDSNKHIIYINILVEKRVVL